MSDDLSPMPLWMRIGLPALGVALMFAVWQVLATWVNTPGLLPSPMQTLLTLTTWATGGGFGPHVTATVTGADVPTFPAASYALLVSVCEAFAAVVVSHEAV